MLGRRDDGLGPHWQLACHRSTDEPAITANATADESWNKDHFLYSAFHASAGFILNYLHGTVANGNPFSIPEIDLLSWPGPVTSHSVEGALLALFGSLRKAVGDALCIERPEWTGAPNITLDSEGVVLGQKGGCVTLTGIKTTVFYSSQRALVASEFECRLQPNRVGSVEAERTQKGR